MATTIIALIRIYQVVVSPLAIIFPGYGCRFYPTCSEYARRAIKGHGAAQGVVMGFFRILKCNPWSL